MCSTKNVLNILVVEVDEAKVRCHVVSLSDQKVLFWQSPLVSVLNAKTTFDRTALGGTNVSRKPPSLQNVGMPHLRLSFAETYTSSHSL